MTEMKWQQRVDKTIIYTSNQKVKINRIKTIIISNTMANNLTCKIQKL